ncbi:MAG TPA: hypothetical protein PLW44_08425 [Chitinophagales bacterium]|nr:hypothetical protein [Chitinophagales bacterium]
MDYRDFNATILPNEPTPRKSSNTFVLVAIFGALGIIVLFFIINLVTPNQPLLIWIGVALYLAALLLTRAISKDENDEPLKQPTPAIGTLFTLTDDYIAITSGHGVEKYMLSDIKYIEFKSMRTSRFDIPKKWRCQFKANNTIYRLNLEGDYGQWETLCKRCKVLKSRGIILAYGEILQINKILKVQGWVNIRFSQKPNNQQFEGGVG